MVKVGDKVRLIRHRNCFGDKIIPDYEAQKIVTTLESIDHELTSEYFTMYVTDPINGSPWLVRSDDIEPVNDSPVRTVTRLEIVPGTYGRVKIGEDGWVGLTSCDFQHGTYMTAEELDSAAMVFSQLAEALRDG